MAVATAVTSASSASREFKAGKLRMALQNARQLVQSGTPGDALPWYVQALDLETGDPGREAVHRTRLASIIKSSLRPSRVWWQPAPVENVCFDQRVRLLACGAVGRVWDLRNPETGPGPPAAHPGNMVRCLSAAFGPHGPLALVTSGDGKRLQIVEAISGKDVAPPIDGEAAVTRAIFGPGGKLVATVRGTTVEVRETATGRLVGKPRKHPDLVNDLAFSPDGRSLLVGYGGPEQQVGEAWLWDVSESAADPLHKFPHEDDVLSVAFSSDGRRAVTASFDRTARVWDIKAGTSLATLSHGERLSLARLSPDGSLVATASLTEARLWSATRGIPVGAPMRHGGQIRHLQWNTEGSHLLTAGDDQRARVWDTRDGLPAWEPLPHEARITAATFTPDGEAVVTACEDGTTRLWESAERQHPFLSISHAYYVRDAEFGRRGAWLVTASADATARAWDAVTGRPQSPPLHHRQAVTRASVGADGGEIVTTCAAAPPRKPRLGSGGPRMAGTAWTSVPSPPASPSSSRGATGS